MTTKRCLPKIGVLIVLSVIVASCAQKTATPTESLIVDDGRPLAPNVIGQNPSLGEEAQLDSVFEIYFDQAMETASTSAAFRVVDPEGETLDGQITWPDDRTLRFDPTNNLLPGTSYEATLGTGATSVEGVSLAAEVGLYFNTVSRLQVVQVFPAEGTTDAESGTLITAMFNRPVVPLVTSTSQPDLVQPLSFSPEIEGQGEWLNTSVFVFRPDKPLAGGTTYTVTIAAGLSDVSGAVETRLSQAVSWRFTTEAPTIHSFSIPGLITGPPDNYRDVPLNAAFSIKFRQPMDPSSTEAAFTLTPYLAEPVAGQFEWDEDNVEVTFTPARSLTLGTGYRLSIDSSAQALDGGGLKEGLNWSFYTVFPPAIVRVTPANNEIQNFFSDTFTIEFASPMDEESLENRIVLSPRPEGELRWRYSNYLREMTVYGLEPSTDYTVRIVSGMADPYGNTISESTTVHFRTAAREPSARLQTPGDYALLRAQGEHEVYLQHVNVGTIRFSLYQIHPKELVNFRIRGDANVEYNAFPGSLVNNWTITASGPRDEDNFQKVELKTSEGEPLPPGMYFLGIESDEIRYTSRWLDARILIVATANMTMKTTASDGLVWLTDLESGEPIGDVRIIVYEEAPGSIASATTDQDGLATLDLPIPEERYTRRYFFAQDDEHFAFCMNYMGIDFYPSDYGIYTNYELQPNQPSVYIYTDRPLYRPGQTVYFKGIVRINDDLDYSLPAAEKIEVTISNYDETVFEQTLPLSPFGSFDGELTLDTGAALGNYSIRVGFPGEEDSIGWRSFNVAEYRKPEFEVEVQTTQSAIMDGDTLEATVRAEFYSGGPVAESQVDWVLRAENYVFYGSGEYSRYQFYDYENDVYYRYYTPYAYGELIAEGTGVTDENGELVISLPIDLSELGSSQRLTLEATVSDLSGNAVSGRVQVVAHWSEFYIGARSQRYVGRTDEEQTFDLVALDWDGVPVANKTLTVEIVERRWHSVQELDEYGRSVWTSSVEEIPTTGFIDVHTDDEGRASVSFVPPSGGIYRAKVTALDSRGTETRSSAYTWISGPDYVSWRRSNDHSIRLVTDRDDYQPGDTAEIMITSPFQGPVYALVTVERGHVRSADVIELQDNSTIYQLPITADMAPNVYVSVVLIKGVDPTSPVPDYRMGLTEILVDTRQQTLNIEITPDKTEAGPGDRVTYTLLATDHEGQPVQAELSFSLVDLALLALADPNAPPMIDYFYSTRSLTVLTAMPLRVSVDSYNAEISEHAKGGGGGGGDMGVMEVREDFPDTAFWNSRVVTDEDGQASVTVTLPDNLTTWRMDARAVTMDTLVGENIVDIVSSKPLLVRPQTPRFFVVGDELYLGTAVHNNTGMSLTVTVKLEAEGVEIEAEASQKVTIRDGAQAFVQWPVRVEDDAERVDLVFSASGSGYSDASRPTLGTLDGQGIPVYHYEVPETVGTAGELTAGGSRTEAVSLPVLANYEITEGNLTISLAPSLVAGFTDGLTYLEHFPYECTEQTISRFLPNVVTSRTLEEVGITDAELKAKLDEQVNLALQRLYNQQHADGGWGWWPTSESSPLSTAYVVHGLIEADMSGYYVNPRVLDSALGYLHEQLQPLGTLEAPYRLNRQAYLLYVLARAGEAAVSDTVKLYEARQTLDLYARGYLAQTLHMIDPNDPRLDTLISDFINHAALSATGTHWNESRGDYWNWNTDTRTTAIVLDTMILIDPDNALNAGAVRWLMANRTQGRWRGTQETVWSLLALNRWASTSGDLEPEYLYEAALNGEGIGGGTASTATIRDTQDIKVDVVDLLTDQVNRLTIARNNGPGNLYYTTHLMVAMPVNEVQALSQGITVSRSYYHPDDRDTPITSIDQGEIFLARLTFIVPHDVHYMFVEDPLPAGLEAVSQWLQTSPQQSAPERYDMDDMFSMGWGWWYFDNVELRDEKVVISASYLPAGVYEYVYLVRASTPGSFQVIPPTAQEFYFPEVYGRGEGSLFEVTQ